MPNDRLRHDRDDVENLEDIIEARDEGASRAGWDLDAGETDFDIPEDIDVDDALTFPHPKHKKDPNADVDLMSTPHKENVDINWEESQHDMLPSDYMDNYDDAVTTDVYDDDDVLAEEEIGEIGDVMGDELVDEEPLTTPMPKGFKPEAEPES